MIGAFGLAITVIAIFVGLFRTGSANTAPKAPVAAWSFQPSDVTLAGPNPLMLTQGDSYAELGIALSQPMQQALAADGRPAPAVSFEYSEPGVAFADFLPHVGAFTVEYTIEAPWMGSAPLKLTRTVQVADVDECTYSGTNPAFHHNCASENHCINTAGSFACN